MPAVQGRRKAPRLRVGKTLIQGWVPVEIHEKASRAADAAGVSLTLYLQKLIANDQVDENGCPVWLPRVDTEQEELPLRTA